MTAAQTLYCAHLQEIATAHQKCLEIIEDRHGHKIRDYPDDIRPLWDHHHHRASQAIAMRLDAINQLPF